VVQPNKQGWISFSLKKTNKSCIINKLLLFLQTQFNLIIMGKSKEMFNREREQQSETLASFIDDEYQIAEYHHNQQRLVLNEIFTAWGEIFGGTKESAFNLSKSKKTKFNLSKNKSNEERNI
tara:strand:+ start:2257 stop:2622 length:366 start_codon:yes stop_codon:yes gene_type:complete